MGRTLEQIFPPFGLELRCGDVILAGTRPEHIQDLADTAKDGVYDGECPFSFDWPNLPDQDLSMYQHCWDNFAKFSPTSWSLKLSVMVDGHAIGCQDVSSKGGFGKTKSLATGSWIGLKHQSRGLGTRMRQMIAMFCFDHLGAEVLESEYLSGNVKSAGVSRKVGYVENGQHRVALAHGVRTKHSIRLTPELLVRPEEPLEVKGVDAFRAFIGLD